MRPKLYAVWLNSRHKPFMYAQVGLPVASALVRGYGRRVVWTIAYEPNDAIEKVQGEAPESLDKMVFPEILH